MKKVLIIGIGADHTVYIVKTTNYNNALMASQKARGASSYTIPFDISGLPSGVYAVLLETPFGNSLRKVILK